MKFMTILTTDAKRLPGKPGALVVGNAAFGDARVESVRGVDSGRAKNSQRDTINTNARS